MQKSSKAVQSNFRATTRGIHEGRITLLDITNGLIQDTIKFTALPLALMLGAGTILWLLAQSPAAGLLALTYGVYFILNR